MFTCRAMTARTRLREQSQQSQSLDESNLFGGARAALMTSGGQETDASGHHQLGASTVNPGASSGEHGARAAESYNSKDDRRDPRGVTQQERGIKPVEPPAEQQRGGREVGFIAMLFKVCYIQIRDQLFLYTDPGLSLPVCSRRGRVGILLLYPAPHRRPPPASRRESPVFRPG
jgi:hypothetical protein